MTPPITTPPETPEPQSTAPGRSVGADEGLREALAKALNPKAFDAYDASPPGMTGERLNAVWAMNNARGLADDLLAGPLATLTADRDRLVRELAARDARIAELEAALGPFVAYAEIALREESDFGDGEIGELYHRGVRFSIRTQHLRAARESLTQGGEHGEP